MKKEKVMETFLFWRDKYSDIDWYHSIKKYKLNHEEDPHSEFADRHNGRYILDLVIKWTNYDVFKVAAHNLIKKITKFLCSGQNLRN